MARHAYFADLKDLHKLEVIQSTPYKRLHLRFCVAVHLIAGFLAWMSIFWINQELAFELRWFFVIVTILSAIALYIMKAREILPKK